MLKHSTNHQSNLTQGQHPPAHYLHKPSHIFTNEANSYETTHSYCMLTAIILPPLPASNSFSFFLVFLFLPSKMPRKCSPKHARAPNLLSFKGVHAPPSGCLRGYFHPLFIHLESVTLYSELPAFHKPWMRTQNLILNVAFGFWLSSVTYTASHNSIIFRTRISQCLKTQST